MADTANLNDGQVADIHYTFQKNDGSDTTIDLSDRQPTVTSSDPSVDIQVTVNGNQSVDVVATAVGTVAEDTLVTIDCDADADRDPGEDRAVNVRATLVRKAGEAVGGTASVVVRP